MKLYKRAQMKRMPWKNGLGVTTEIIIDPVTASLSDGNFDWRISCAEVKSPNQFSNFVGYDRLLTSWKGAGLILNGKAIGPFVVEEFPGERKIDCDLIAGDVTDFGIIFRRGTIDADLEVHRLSSDESLEVTVKEDEKKVFFCASENLRVSGYSLDEGDALFVDKPGRFAVASLQPACVLVATMKMVN